MEIIRIVSENKVGLLAEISGELGENRVNIESIGAEVIGEKAVISLGVNNAKKAYDVLAKKGYSVDKSVSLLIKIPNYPGEINKITTKLSEKGIDLIDIQKVLEDGNSGVFSLVVDNTRKAREVVSDILVHKYD